ncbi:uncharacterized protein LOC128276195 [Anopheles cruzii]|uniref:uncharacterized protein LOC128273718 n=1 Tax=Anopheles cruzii TaxID=68878 RepID=UPI0022EC1B35|nr:uncharacterized protein LOC128273718 [Anopheles cruzii]XP_052867987.1 uncharacterized protein LOC128273954 [Anopheles cruzii]XP_052870624.1 uncharacterized protein LOC128276195 [Anopheles cruzii]
MSEVRTPPKTVNHRRSLGKGCSYDSSSDEDGCLSPFNASQDGEAPFTGASGLLDEMPPFTAESLSPSARSLSPIERESFESSSPTSGHEQYSGCSTPVGKDTESGRQPPEAGGWVTLDELHARIGLTPPDLHASRTRLNLETIFEGVFLETPPKKEFQSVGNLLRRSIKNRAIQFEKVDQKESTAN